MYCKIMYESQGRELISRLKLYIFFDNKILKIKMQHIEPLLRFLLENNFFVQNISLVNHFMTSNPSGVLSMNTIDVRFALKT